jgi:S-layer protein (TIGR01564 family)
MFKEGTVEDGAATVSVSASAESDDKQIYVDSSKTENYGNYSDAAFVTSADKDYNDAFLATFNGTFGDIEYSQVVELGKLDTLTEVDDIDPSEWNNSDENNAAEMLYVKVSEINDSKKGEYKIFDNDALYMSLTFLDNKTDFEQLRAGNRIPILGEEYVFLKIDKDDDYIAVGKEAFDGVIKEGESYDLGNGYSVTVDSVLEPISGGSPKVNIKILKDGKVVSEKFDNTPLTAIYGDVGVVVNSAWRNVGQDYGYAELVITKDTVKADLGEEFVPDWVLYAVDKDDGNLEDDGSKIGTPIGIALQFDDDDKDVEAGDDFPIADYASFELEDDDDDINALFNMDQAKEVSLAIGQSVSVLNAEIKLSEIDAEAKEAVVMTAPIAVLDSEASLDAADKGLILVGGPVVNALTAELADAGLVAIDNESPATLAVAAGAANGNDVLVVAGGDRAATEEAAEALIDML